jgi:hypothetical protein
MYNLTGGAVGNVGASKPDQRSRRDLDRLAPTPKRDFFIDTLPVTRSSGCLDGPASRHGSLNSQTQTPTQTPNPKHSLP